MQLLGLDHMPADPGEVCRISSRSRRLEIAVTATLTDDLAVLVEKARAELADSPADAGRLVVYAGPGFLGPEVITDTLYVHVEELAELLSAAGGDLVMLALWVLELTGHPGIDAIACYDVLDAWSTWHAQATLLPPGPPEEGVAAVESIGRDVSWDRAAIWARTDDILTATGLQPAIEWAEARLTEAAEGEGNWGRPRPEHRRTAGPGLRQQPSATHRARARGGMRMAVAGEGVLALLRAGGCLKLVLW